MINKEIIIMTVLTMIKEYGIRFTMTSLSKKLGISKRTLYTIYPSKESIFEMIIDETFRDINNQKQDIFDNESYNDYEKLDKTLHIIPKYALLSDFRKTHELHSLYPLLYDKINKLIDEGVAINASLLKTSIEKNYIIDIPYPILQLNLGSIYKSVIDGKLLIEHNITYEDAVTKSINIFLHAISSKKET